jgi:hypothetical protein
MLFVIYAACHNEVHSVRSYYAECRYSECCYAESHSVICVQSQAAYKESSAIMLFVIYAACHNEVHSVRSYYAECRYSECRYAESHSAMCVQCQYLDLNVL